MLRILFLGFILISMHSAKAQGSINDYKYIVVPKNYSFLKGDDMYQLNSLTNFLFNKYGFEAYMQGNEYPKDLKDNGCKALRADLKRKSSMFVTKLTLDLIDCNGTIIYTSEEGKSREKEFKKAYHEALRDLFKSVKTLNYKYSGDKKEDTVKKERVKSPEIKEKVVISSPSENLITYLYNDVNYIFKKQEYGYELFKKEVQVSIGKAFKSTNGQSYIVDAGDLSGHGYFDNYGNFILERINPLTSKLITDTLARQ
ncbi:hypothetical protein [Aquimarina longa]|uniref:hypothetical protein n=1 Tax=Aquimarina longa TaxID=1080221 RepID=UPI000785CF11|nr:hypothetical protein [Aquimarina longa]